MSEEDESKKRQREEELEDPSSEPQQKQSKVETGNHDDGADTPTQSNEKNPIEAQQNSTVSGEKEHHQTSESSTAEIANHSFEASQDVITSEQASNTTQTTTTNEGEAIAQDTSTQENEQQEGENLATQAISESTQGNMYDRQQQGEKTAAVASQGTGEQKEASPQPYHQSIRPGDPVATSVYAEVNQEDIRAATEASDILAGQSVGTDVVAGVMAATERPSVAAPEQEQDIQISPDKLAPPPEAGFDPEQEVEEKGEISAVIAGRVIGKGGEVIRDLQARSGASIDVDAAPSGTHRIVTYRGPRRKVDFAKQLVDMISRGMSDADLPLGEATREVLLIPASATGKVIGRGGEMVREMQTRSQAKIDFDHAATANRPDQKQVVVTGTADAVRKANEMIMFLVANPQLEAMQALNLLVNEKLASGQPWGSGPPYPSLPNAGSNMQPEMLGSYGSPGGYGPDAQYATAPQSQSSYGRPPEPRYGGGASAGMGEDIFYAKKQFMGRIIGQKGITINDLQKRSGADIQINQDVAPGQECEIRIRGTRDGIEMAKHMLRQIIEIGPGHPYAGGGGSGPGGPGASHGGGYGGAPYQSAGGGYDYGGQSYGFPPQQQTQGSYGYPPQPGGGYGGPPQGGPSYQSYGGYPGQDYGGSAGGGYGGAPAPYGGAPAAYDARGGYPSQSSVYPPSYTQGGGYAPQHSSMPPQQQAYGGSGAYGQTGPPSYPPGPAAAASGWKSATSPDGQIYYYNETTGATQWEKPPGFA